MSADQPILISNTQVFINKSLATSINSASVDLTHGCTFAVQLTVTGTAAGTVQVEGSCDNINWGSDGSAITLSAAGTTITNFPDRGYPWVRLAFTEDSGSGTLNAYISVKAP